MSEQFESERRECLDILMESDRIESERARAVSGLQYAPYESFHQMRENNFTDEMIAHAFSLPVSDVEETIQALDKHQDDYLANIQRQQEFHRKTGQVATSREARKHYRIASSEGYFDDEPSYMLVDKVIKL
ncbi:hypothetical protein [Erwinia phage vB_Ea277G]|nr:hypothetical protein [Erwinia phage vB_Ea277G]